MLGAVGLLVAVATVAGVVLVARDPSRSAAPQESPPKVTPSATTRQPGSGQDPASAASGLRWTDYHGVRLPSHDLDGPRHGDGSRASGFARTPRGALLAAINIGVRANAQWGPRVFEPTIEAQVTGADKAALLASTRAFYEDRRTMAGISAGESLGRAYVVVEAFRWQGYTPKAASLDLVTAGPGDGGTTARASTRLQLQWHDGDWKLVAPPGGDWGNSATPVSELRGFTILMGGGS